jgi:hypothetical protein
LIWLYFFEKIKEKHNALALIVLKGKFANTPQPFIAATVKLYIITV